MGQELKGVDWLDYAEPYQIPADCQLPAELPMKWNHRACPAKEKLSITAPNPHLRGNGYGPTFSADN